MADALIQAELALVSYLKPLLLGTDLVYAGRRSLTKEAPCVVCFAESGVEDPLGTGNYRVKLNVIVKTIMTAPEEVDGVVPDLDAAAVSHAALVERVRVALKVSDLADLVSAALADFSCFGAHDRGRGITIEDSIEGDVFHWELYCCGSDIA